MPHSRIARATKYPLSVVIEFPYEPALIETIKRDFASYSRSYDPQSRTWTIKEPHADRAIRLLIEFFPSAEVRTIGERQEQTQARRREPMARTDHFAVLCVTPDAPAEVVRAAYTALVKLHHPDRLPAPRRDQAHTAMIALNAAIEALRAEGRA